MVNTGTPSGRCLTCKEDKAKVRLPLLTARTAGPFIYKIPALMPSAARPVRPQEALLRTMRAAEQDLRRLLG